jgi:hypothetical protein
MFLMLAGGGGGGEWGGPLLRGGQYSKKRLVKEGVVRGEIPLIDKGKRFSRI